MKFKLSPSIEKRCQVQRNTIATKDLYHNIEKDFFPFLKENQDFIKNISFYIAINQDKTLIEFIKPCEISPSLVEEMIAIINHFPLYTKIIIKNDDYPKFNAFISLVKENKIKKLLGSHSDLDKKTLDAYNKLSSSVDHLSFSGLNSKNIKEIEQNINLMMLNIISDENSFYTLTKSFIIDDTLYEHTTSVAMFSYMLAKAANRRGITKFDRSQLSTISLCGCCHDIGKKCVPEEILNKPSALNDKEFEEMKKHTLHGFELIEEIEKKGSPLPEEVKTVVIQHHEKMNGSGYPFGLKGAKEKGGDIHVFSRIVSICDVYSALQMKRVYKDAFSPEQIYKIMSNISEASFDPELYQIFMSDIFKVKTSKYQNMVKQSKIIHFEDLKKSK